MTGNNIRCLPVSKKRRKKNKPKFDGRGGVIVMCRYMLNHDAYITLMPQAKVLMQLLQQHWQDEKEVDYGIREASTKIPCSRKTAMKAFDQLEKRGFITKTSEAMFSSRTFSKSRSWRLNWMPFCGREPTQQWDNAQS